MKNKYLNILLIVLLTILVLYFSLRDNYHEIINLVLKADIKWLIFGYLLVLSYTFLKSIVTNDIINKFVNYEMKKTFSLQLMIFFFNAITPFASGGQPFQIYVLNKNKVSISNSTNIVIQETIIHQIALIIVGLFMIFINSLLNICELEGLIKWFLLLGFTLNVIIVVLLFAISQGNKIDNLVLNFVTKIFTFFKIIKDKEKTIDKWEKSISDFTSNSKKLLKDKKRFIKLIMINVFALICFNLVPLTVLFSLGDYSSFNALTSLVLVTFISIISSYVPFPGGMGGQEYMFTVLFGAYLINPKLGSLMILWRFITYYLPMIIGAFVFNISGKRV